MEEELPSTVSSERVFQGRVFAVRIDQVRYADASVHRFDVVEHRRSLGIIPTLPSGEVIMVRQYRHAIGRMGWEVPAGMSEPGETCADGALRELREETGYRARRVRALGAVFMTPGFCSEAMHFFHADGLDAGAQSLDQDERIEVGSFTLERAAELLQAGEISDAKTLIALLWLGGSRGQLAADIVDT